MKSIIFFTFFLIIAIINNTLGIEETKTTSIVYLEPVENIIDSIKNFQILHPLLRSKRDIHRPLFDYRHQQQRVEANRKRRQSRQRQQLSRNRVRYFAVA